MSVEETHPPESHPKPPTLPRSAPIDVLWPSALSEWTAARTGESKEYEAKAAPTRSEASAEMWCRGRKKCVLDQQTRRIDRQLQSDGRKDDLRFLQKGWRAAGVSSGSLASQGRKAKSQRSPTLSDPRRPPPRAAPVDASMSLPNLSVQLIVRETAENWQLSRIEAMMRRRPVAALSMGGI